MGLHENMLTETVESLSLREPVLGRPDETVRDAVQRMRETQIGCVFIVNEEGKPIGMFSEVQLNRLLALRPEALAEPLETHMAREWCAVKLSDRVHCVCAALQGEGVRFVCVLDDEGRAVGLTGQKGLMEYIAEHFPGQVMVHRIGCAPYILEREGA